MRSGRRLARGLALLGVALAGGLVWVRLLAGGPVLPGIPGGWIRGEPTRELPADWSFANREPYLLVESGAGTFPYSARVWFIAHRGRLHLLLPSFFGDGLQRLLDADPRLRVGVDGRVYEQLAVRVRDEADLGALAAPILRRQFAIEIGDRVRALPPGGTAAGVELAIYRLEDPR